MDAAIAAAWDHANELDEHLIATVEKLRGVEAERDRLRAAIEQHRMDVFSEPVLARPVDERLWDSLNK